MKIAFVVLILSAICTVSTALAPTLRRRAFLLTTATTLVGTPYQAQAAIDPTVVEGTYTDPINHPGGTRTIKLTGTGLGEYQLAKVNGGGGKGEPKNYSLDAMVAPCAKARASSGQEVCITIDFTPKGGPANFGGFYDEKEKGIRFPVDGNFWPKVE